MKPPESYGPTSRWRLFTWRWIGIAATAGVIVAAAFWAVSRKGDGMSKPGFDAPEGKQRGQEEAALPYPGGVKSSSVSAIKDKHEADLMAMDGVEGIGIGQDPLGNEAIVVYVRDQEAAKRIPTRLEGVVVQVLVTGKIDALKPK